MKQGKNQQKKPLIRKGTILVIGILLLATAVGGVFAKYVYNAGGRYLLSAKEFYFTSSLLKEKTAKYILNSTTTEVTFTLGNNADQLRVSQTDIDYTVLVETKNGSGQPQILDSNAEPVLLGDQLSEATITLAGLKKGETYLVTATGRAGYKQTLKAEFTVSDNDENVYMHLDATDPAYVRLSVWTGNVTGQLKISAPAGLIPDNTDPILREVYNYGDAGYGAMEITDGVNFGKAYSSYTYRFFKANGGSFSTNNFQVSVEKDGATYPAKAADIPK